MNNKDKNFYKIINHLKETGFVFQGSQIYGGLANTWDYGPLGAKLKNNIKKIWRSFFIEKHSNIFEIDSKILLNPLVWKASGHINNFCDPLIENKINGKRYRADHIIKEIDDSINVESMSNKEIEEYLQKNVSYYENSKTKWSNIKNFNLMFETKQGVIENKKSSIYLRPEIAQGIFINFKNVQRSTRAKIPFGIAQIGKSFRNEVTPGNFIYRTREFEQMELEFFVKPEHDEKTHKMYVQKSYEFMTLLGLKKKSLFIREHDKNELAHYSKATTDIEFQFPFGKGELMGIANRRDYDLKSHQNLSTENLQYLDPINNEKYIPYVIEPSVGVDRLLLAILIDAYHEEKINNCERIVLKIDHKLAPYKFAILPLNKKIHQKQAKKVYDQLLKKGLNVIYDETGSIGKRYRRQDAIGTPFVITIIDQTITENKVTIRFRDTMLQEEINLSEIKKY